MIEFHDIALRRGPKRLFGGVNLKIHAGWRVGLTGANGCGKSSLFELLLGRLHSDAGDWSMPGDWVIAHVAQHTEATGRSALDYVIDGDAPLRELQAALEQAERTGDGARIGDLHAEMDRIDGYAAEARAGRLLHGLGFSDDQLGAGVKSFSGGWRMRLNLARALMCRSDLLLLDEPTNHLDLDAVIWLEGWLRSYTGTLLMISHDREFLDAVVGHIAHIEQAGLRLYAGNYSQFERQRAEHLAQQQSGYEKQQREIAHMQDFVRRFRAKATKARQAQSRLKALERMQLIAPAHIDSQFQFEFAEPAQLPDPLLSLREAAVGYDATPILDGVDLHLLPGSRVGLIGLNGAGKSTLVKALAERLPLMRGELEIAKGTKLAFFEQHQLEQLDPEASALLHLKRLDAELPGAAAREQQLRDFLGGFGFRGDRVDEPVAPFSGGEKARLVLALIVYQKPNLLLLDEPTNHLDLDMRFALTSALQSFGGALVVISHDRHLLRTVTDTLWLVDAGRVAVFDGDIDSYPAWLAKRNAGDAQTLTTTPGESAGLAVEKAPNSAQDRKAARRDAAAQRAKTQPMRQRMARLEKTMDKLNAEKAGFESELASPEAYAEANKDRLKDLLFDQARLTREIEQLEEEWMQIADELEALHA